MHMRVLNAGNEQPAIERDHLCGRADKVGNVTRRGDAAAPHRHVKRPRAARDKGSSAHEDKICVHRGIR
jgi:hypothetical protein